MIFGVGSKSVSRNWAQPCCFQNLYLFGLYFCRLILNSTSAERFYFSLIFYFCLSITGLSSQIIIYYWPLSLRILQLFSSSLFSFLSYNRINRKLYSLRMNYLKIYLVAVYLKYLAVNWLQELYLTQAVTIYRIACGQLPYTMTYEYLYTIKVLCILYIVTIKN